MRLPWDANSDLQCWVSHTSVAKALRNGFDRIRLLAMKGSEFPLTKGRALNPSSPGPQKQDYATPRLVVYGDLRRLTLVKGGSRGDGPFKPRSRASGAVT